MKIAELKSEFHNLIDKIEDPDLLLQFYDVISQSVNINNSIWQSLSVAQQQGILEAYDESEDENNLVSLSVLKSKYNEWPLK